MTRPRSLALLAALALAAACGGEGRAPIAPPDDRPPLPAGVHEIATLAADAAHADLAPLRAIVGDATVVGLGESTHTSDGYYRAKYRMIRFLVEEMGFRVVAFETPWLDARAAAEYVATCAGTPEAALQKFIIVWRATSVRDMLRWLCEYNAAHPTDRVTFVGVDVQDPWSLAPAIVGFVERAASDQTARAAPLRRCLGAGAADATSFYASAQYQDFLAGRPAAAADHLACLAALDDVEAWAATNAAALAATTSPRQVEEARIALVALRASEQQFWVPFPGGFEVRDRAMAELTVRLRDLEAPGKKVALWAWNWHVAKRYQDVRGWNDDPAAVIDRHGGRSMGSFLEERLGGQYRAVALIAREVGLVYGVAPPLAASELAIEKRLHALERDYLLVDLRQPVGGALMPPGPTYQISQEWGDPYRQFDALFYLARSGPMTPIP